MPHNNTLPIPLEPGHLLQASNFHIGIVKDVKDPMGRGRVRVLARSICDDAGGPKNWTNWAEVCRFPVGGFGGTGDFGMWWCPVPGELVAVGFLGGDYMFPIVMPFSAPQATPEEKKARIPLEAKALGDQEIRKGTRIRIIKTEAGGTLGWDDNGQGEAMFLIDWTGAGLFAVCPGKTKDDEEKPKEESKFRKGETRGVKSVMAGTSKKPSEIIKGGKAVTGFLDLNGQGWLNVAEDDKGRVTIFAAKEVGKIGPSIILDAENDLILLTAKETQIQIDGKAGHIMVTRQMILNAVFIEVKDFFRSIFEGLAMFFSRYQATPVEPKKGPPTEVIVA